jgi:hypothetical protein
MAPHIVGAAEPLALGDACADRAAAQHMARIDARGSEAANPKPAHAQQPPPQPQHSSTLVMRGLLSWAAALLVDCSRGRLLSSCAALAGGCSRRGLLSRAAALVVCCSQLSLVLHTADGVTGRVARAWPTGGYDGGGSLFFVLSRCAARRGLPGGHTPQIWVPLRRSCVRLCMCRVLGPAPSSVERGSPPAWGTGQPPPPPVRSDPLAARAWPVQINTQFKPSFPPSRAPARQDTCPHTLELHGHSKHLSPLSPPHTHTRVSARSLSESLPAGYGPGAE